MGLAKRLWMEQLAKGYTPPDDRFVCQACIKDQCLSQILKAASEEVSCSYCDSPNAAHISVLIDEIMDAIKEDFDDPADELPYDGKEGGWQGTVYDNWEILDQLDPWTDRGDLQTDVASAISERDWCKKDYFALDSFEALNYGWDRFKQQVLHRKRYLFMTPENGSLYDDHGSILPHQMLEKIAELFRELHMFRELPVGTTLFRARVTKRDQCLSTAKELGTPTEHDARYPNRMSPAGIPMFYAAFRKKTAIAETFDTKRGNPSELVIHLASFETSVPLVLVDLAKLPTQPSCFDRTERHMIKSIRFLLNFRDDLTKPIAKDGREHTEYVPTQIVTEYIRHQVNYGEQEKCRIDGLVYPSTKDSDGESVVLFAESKNCGGSIHRDSQRLPKSFDHGQDKQDVFLHLIDIERANPGSGFAGR